MADLPDDILNLSDEDFAKLAAPTGAASSSSEEVVEQEPTVQEPEVEAPAAVVEEPKPEPEPEAEPAPKVEPEVEAEKPKTEAEPEADPNKQTPVVEAENPTEKAAEATEVDYKGFYDQIMKPFKANGRMIELKDPSEAVQLMQMGANYTRKMQDLQEHRKVLLTLQNNGLLDQDKLNYLIDLDKKNPEAIKKLIKDSGIDPLEIDPSAEPNYVASSHAVTDEEVAFTTVLDDLQSSDEGKETITTIHNGWDQASKQHVYSNPETLRVIHEQRQSGIYGLIVNEMERLKTLGQIPAGVPFLSAYKTIGDHLMESGAFAALNKTEEEPKPREPVAVKPAAPKPVVDNQDKVNAVASTPAAPTKKEPFVNYMAMSDEEFLKLNKRV